MSFCIIFCWPIRCNFFREGPAAHVGKNMSKSLGSVAGKEQIRVTNSLIKRCFGDLYDELDEKFQSPGCTFKGERPLFGMIFEGSLRNFCWYSWTWSSYIGIHCRHEFKSFLFPYFFPPVFRMFTANLRQMRTEIQNSLDNDGDYDDDDEVGTESRQFDVVDIEPVDLSHLGTLNSTERPWHRFWRCNIAPTIVQSQLCASQRMTQ